MTLLLDALPWTPPPPIAPLLSQHSASGALLAPIRYTSNRGQGLAAAVDESIEVYQEKRGAAPTAAEAHPLNLPLIALLERAGLAVTRNRQVGMTTWGLTHSEARS